MLRKRYFRLGHIRRLSAAPSTAMVSVKSLTLNAKAGQTYTVSFPAVLSGYTYLSTACDMMTLS